MFGGRAGALFRPIQMSVFRRLLARHSQASWRRNQWPNESHADRVSPSTLVVIVEVVGVACPPNLLLDDDTVAGHAVVEAHRSTNLPTFAGASSLTTDQQSRRLEGYHFFASSRATTATAIAASTTGIVSASRWRGRDRPPSRGHASDGAGLRRLRGVSCPAHNAQQSLCWW